MRTIQEIARQIEGLEKMKKSLPEKTLFGDNNWGAIDAQISILDKSKTLDQFDEDEESEHLYSQVMEADSWLSGHSSEDLFDEEY